MSEIEIPNSWASTRLENLCDLLNGFAFKSKDYIEHGDFVIRIGNVQDGTVVLNNPAYIDSAAFGLERFKLEASDLLMSLTGNVGRVAIIKETHLPAVLNQRVAKLVPVVEGAISETWLYHALRAPIFKTNLLKTAKGAAQLNISGKDVLGQDISLPPLAEQQQIAARLDALLAQVDTLKTRLDSIPSILKRFRQSVLAAAVSGRLTEEWRGTPELVGWESKTLLDVVQAKPRNGNSPKGVDYETPYRNLTLSATTKGHFIEGKFKYVAIDISEDSYLWVRPGDVLIQRANTLEYVGVSAIYKGAEHRYIYPDLMMKCTPNDSVSGNYLHYSLLSQQVRKYFRDNATGTAGNMPKINQKTVSLAPINLPSIEEQTEIVRRVEQLFAFADQIEQRVKDAQFRVNHLTQSILAKAFRGELTAEWREQNPDLISGDNSAEALLARIESERTNPSKKKPKAARINRKAKMEKLSLETLTDQIQTIPEDSFTFDQLRQHINSDYETLRELLFQLLDSPGTPLKQVFDPKAKQMILVRS
jgi:type I restriction enzyme S subunit